MKELLLENFEKRSAGPFVETIYQLRTVQQFVIREKIYKVNKSEEKEILEFLEMEFEEEMYNFPTTDLVFDKEAALWASKIVYYSGQLIFYRENKLSELVEMLPPIDIGYSPSSVLSADLCLRFLPDIVEELKTIDSDDHIIPTLESILKQCHYSAIGYSLEISEENLANYLNEPSLKWMYLSKVVKTKDIKLAQNSLIKQELKNYMGHYQDLIWPQF